jgi:succinate dehydrogenase/fumarate reductase flavoprotein subunit
MDFAQNPRGNDLMTNFDVNDLEPEAYEYLKKTGALQATPIERLTHLNPLAIEIYKENGIDLYCEPLEIAVCAQHNNGGFLNAGQVGGLRAAEYIANVYDLDTPDYSDTQDEIDPQLSTFIAKLERWSKSSGLTPKEVISQIQTRMTASAAHIRELSDARKALSEAVEAYRKIERQGFRLKEAGDIITATRAEHLALTSVAYLKAVVELLEQDSGSRGSHLVLADDGTEIHQAVVDKATGKPLKFKPENEALRSSILRIIYDPRLPDLFSCENVPVREAPAYGKAFELGWRDYREGKIYED